MKRSAEAKVQNWLSGGVENFRGTLQERLPIRLHVRSDLHLMRKIWHMGMGMLIAFIYWSGLAASTSVVILACFLGADLLLETARLRIPSVNEAIMKVWGPFMRACEVNRMSGVPYYILSSLLAIAIFPKPVAIVSILFLAVGDPIASLFGIVYGKHSIRFANGKSLIGTTAGVVACTVVAFVFFKAWPISDENVLVLSLIGGLVGGTVELLPFDLDDNFTIPVVSGFVLWLAFICVGA